MGRLVVGAAVEAGHTVVSQIDRKSDISACISGGIDVCIDFSSPGGAVGLCTVAAGLRVPVVTGTTGLSDLDLDAIKRCAESTPILMSSNFSIGVHVLRKLVREAVATLPVDFDVEIIEKHHTGKKDAPSGTALAILDDIKRSGRPVREVFGRSGKSVHVPGEVCIHAVRGGDCVGEHEVFFFGNGERIEVVHRATDRAIFARGAIVAAERFYKIRIPGMYTLADVV
jgi:4-hydroxy-tetrahydrodipicolinate reductase